MIAEAQVVCRMLGFRRALEAYTGCRFIMFLPYFCCCCIFRFGGCGAEFGDAFSLAGVVCRGGEVSLGDCRAEAASSQCGPSMGVGVTCAG